MTARYLRRSTGPAAPSKNQPGREDTTVRLQGESDRRGVIRHRCRRAADRDRGRGISAVRLPGLEEARRCARADGQSASQSSRMTKGCGSARSATSSSVPTTLRSSVWSLRRRRCSIARRSPRWRKNCSFGRDAVVVRSTASILSAGQLPAIKAILDPTQFLLGTRVFTKTGDEQGAVNDIYFDERSGASPPWKNSGRSRDQFHQRDATPAGRRDRAGRALMCCMCGPRPRSSSRPSRVGSPARSAMPVTARGARRPRRRRRHQGCARPGERRGGGSIAGGLARRAAKRSRRRARRRRGPRRERSADLRGGCGAHEGGGQAAGAHGGRRLRAGRNGRRGGRRRARRCRRRLTELWDKFTAKLGQVTDATGERVDEQQTKQRLGVTEDAVGRPVTKVILILDDDVILQFLTPSPTLPSSGRTTPERWTRCSAPSTRPRCRSRRRSFELESRAPPRSMRVPLAGPPSWTSSARKWRPPSVSVRRRTRRSERRTRPIERVARRGATSGSTTGGRQGRADPDADEPHELAGGRARQARDGDGEPLERDRARALTPATPATPAAAPGPGGRLPPRGHAAPHRVRP